MKLIILMISKCVTMEIVFKMSAVQMVMQNQDGTVNVSDIIMVVNHIIGSSTLSGSALCASDLNGDGAINVTDIITIVNVIIGM